MNIKDYLPSDYMTMDDVIRTRAELNKWLKYIQYDRCLDKHDRELRRQLEGIIQARLDYLSDATYKDIVDSNKRVSEYLSILKG